MISKDYMMALILGLIVILAIIAGVQTFGDHASSEVEDKSGSVQNRVECAFADNPEKCRTSTKVEKRFYET